VDRSRNSLEVSFCSSSNIYGSEMFFVEYPTLIYHLSADKNENDDFRRQILNEYIGKQHRDLIIQCAEKQIKISKHIQLMLMLLGKFYDSYHMSHARYVLILIK